MCSFVCAQERPRVAESLIDDRLNVVGVKLLRELYLVNASLDDVPQLVFFGDSRVPISRSVAEFIADLGDGNLEDVVGNKNTDRILRCGVRVEQRKNRDT
jgi:hypothetical protein